MSAVYGILGHPVHHSRSPAMHNAAFAALGIDATYVCFDVLPERLGAAIKGLAALRISGANITVPHKEQVMTWLDEVSDEARAIGAVNTIVREDERLIGHNTDAIGLVRSLEQASVNLEGACVVVLGAGGAARASVVGLAMHGAAEITVAARRPSQADAMLAAVKAACGRAKLATCTLDAAHLSTVFARADLLVQSTSATLEGSAHAEAFARDIPLQMLPDHATVVDLVYKPLVTSVLRASAARGLRVVDGLGMLLHQGARAFELWTARAAPLDIMRDALCR